MESNWDYTIWEDITDIITMRLIYLPQLWKYSKKYYYISCKQFHNVTILTLPKGLNLWLRGHDFQNLERGFMDIISFLCIQIISHYCESKADFLWFNTFSVYCDIWRYWSRPNDWTFDKGAMKKKIERGLHEIFLPHLWE